MAVSPRSRLRQSSRNRANALASAALVLLTIVAACSEEGTSGVPPGPESPAAIRIVDGDQQAGPAGEPLNAPITIAVVDDQNRPVPGVAVTFSATSGGGSLDPAESASDAAGIAAATWTLGSTPGPNRAEARVTGVESATLRATGVVGVAAAVEVVAGGGQVAVMDWPVPVPPAVVVRDAHGNFVANTLVTFGVPPTDGRVEGSLQRTDSMGRAEAQAWVLPTRTGTATLRIGVSGPGVTSIQATVLGLRPVTAIAAAGGWYTCALRPEGEALCFGANDSGERGDSVLGSSAVPRPVGGHRRFATITGGWAHTCGLSPDGEALCWGSNSYGQRGGATGGPIPGPVVGGRVYARIAAGGNSTCALDFAGAVYCWGALDAAGVPTLIAAPEPLVELAAGAAHACGLTAAGKAYCWGLNGNGQLGDSTLADSPTPVAVAGDVAFTQLTAGDLHTCGLSSAGTAWCWGYNRVGQLGDGTQQSRNVPTPMVGGLRLVAIDAGSEVTCGLTALGAAYCGGDNGGGAQGIGSYDDNAHTALEAVIGGNQFTRISVGGTAFGLAHVCALNATSDIYCWGSNSAGQLGNSDPVSRHTPTRADQ